MPQNFQIFKNKFKKEGSKEPDYILSAKDDKGNFFKFGVGWQKEMRGGEKYISCTLNEPNAPQPQGGIL